MGKRGNKNFRGKNRNGQGGRRGTRTDYSDIVKTNELFEGYYNTLEILGEDEREEFWTSLRRDLPNSFRFTGSKGHALSVQKQLIERYIPEITSIKYEGESVEPPKPVEWFPNQLAWEMKTPKNIVRRFPPFASFQKFLVSETTVGNISRQEVVSMIPPLLLDVRPSMTVLDMCAAPGSKAAQLIEMLHAGEETRIRRVLHRIAKEEGREMSPDGAQVEAEMNDEVDLKEYEDDGRTSGLLIANDADYKRAHLLIHQMKRLNSPNVIVTNHDATLYPSIRIPEPTGDKRKHYLKFDRILADVPCSGDGTARKNSNVWKDWNPGNGLGLYITQQRILVRALQMLKVGGRVVYSTCSMNPIENEAVVASAIYRCGGLDNVSVIDCSEALPGLKRRPGLTSWKVMDKQGRIWDSWKDVEEHKEKEGIDGLGRLAEGMFPPGDAETIHLERAMRVYPHLQDTGGFFICVLEKKSEIKAKPEQTSKKVQPKPPIASAVEEIEVRSTDSVVDSVKKIESLDNAKILELHNEETRPLPTTATDDRENQPNDDTASAKRKLEEEEVDAETATKRLKLAEDPDKTPAAKQLIHSPPQPTQLELKPDTSDANLPSLPQKKKNGGQQFEEPFKYLDPNHEQLQLIYDFYKVSPRFPRDRFMVRNSDGKPAKTIYYTSTLARDILVKNEGSGMKFVHCGVKMFVKQEVQKEGVCPWRIQTDGLPILEAWIGEGRVVRLYKRPTLKKLLVEMFPKINGNGWMELGEIGERARDIEMGCCVLRVEQSDDEKGFKERMVLPLWRSLYSFNLMLPKEERKAMLLRLFNDETPLVNETLSHNHNRGTAAKNEEHEAVTPNGKTEVLKPEPEIEPIDPQNGVAAAAKEVFVEDDKEEGGVSLVPKMEEEAIEKEDAAFSKLEDVKTKEVQPFINARDEPDTSNTTG
ncbi:MAG: hypothetical protein M1834_007156 [Cirrosporium novae-zelandiae]|nr:MAG: hypothetical protein M1834_007156 [Cirrosporium novae-zelandiae]